MGATGAQQRGAQGAYVAQVGPRALCPVLLLVQVQVLVQV